MPLALLQARDATDERAEHLVVRVQSAPIRRARRLLIRPGADHGGVSTRSKATIGQRSARWLDRTCEQCGEAFQARETYYWRGDSAGSRQLWLDIVQRLRRSLEYRYLETYRRVRILYGIAFADRVLSGEGQILADPAAPRMVP